MKVLLPVILLALIVAGCVTYDPTPEPIPGPGPQPTPAPTPEPGPEPVPEPPRSSIPPNSLMMFFTEDLGSRSDYVDYWDVGSTYAIPVGLPGGGVQWETDTYAVVGYLPEANQKYVLYPFSSPSYSSNFAYPITRGNRLFIIREWGDPGERTVNTIDELDPVSGDPVSTTHLSPSAGQLAIVGNNVYYRSGGSLYVQELGSSQSRELLGPQDTFNSGTLYGVGNTLVSAVGGNTLEIREHDSSGRITQALHTIPDVFIEMPALYAGETAMYLVGKVGESPDVFQIYSLGLDGSEEVLLEIELSPGETALFIDEEKGKLIISIVKQLKISSVVLYDLTTGSSEEIVLGQTTSLKTGHYGDQYLISD